MKQTKKQKQNTDKNFEIAKQNLTDSLNSTSIKQLTAPKVGEIYADEEGKYQVLYVGKKSAIVIRHLENLELYADSIEIEDLFTELDIFDITELQNELELIDRKSVVFQFSDEFFGISAFNAKHFDFDMGYTRGTVLENPFHFEFTKFIGTLQAEEFPGTLIIISDNLDRLAVVLA